MTIDFSALLADAKKAMSLAHSPYSSNRVGAALLSSSGRVWLGANIGNSCSTLNCCAEQCCIIQAVMNGEKAFRAIAVVQQTSSECFPCGRCLQLLSEFATNLVVVTENDQGVALRKLSELLPHPYKRPLEHPDRRGIT